MRDPVDEVDFEPFDALLEEAVAGGVPAAQPAPRARRRWLAVAAVLLGASVVLAVVLAKERVADVPAQDPKPEPPPKELRTYNELKDALKQQQDLWDQLLESPAGGIRHSEISDPTSRVKVLRELSGMRLQVVDRAARPIRVVAGAEIVIPPARHEAIREGIADALDPLAVIGWQGPSHPFTCQLLLEWQDGRTSPVRLALGPKPLLMWGAFGEWLGEGPFLDELRALYEQATRAERRRRGEAWSIAELRALPADATQVSCPCLTAELARAELPRFTQLQRLAFVPQGLGQLPHGDIVESIAGLRTLRALELPADALDDRDLQALAALPGLEELRLGGRARAITAAGIAGLQQLAVLGLQFEQADARLLDALKQLPRLRSLAVGGAWFDDAAIEALLATKIASLEVEQGTEDLVLPRGTGVTAAGLDRLAELPSLRELVLVRPVVDADVAASLGKLRQLRRLVLRGPALGSRDPQVLLLGGNEAKPQVDRVRAALPDLEVVEEPLVLPVTVRKS